MSNLMSRTLMARIGISQVPKRKENSLKKIPRNVTTIYVPASSVNSYKSADGWKDYANSIQAIP